METRVIRKHVQCAVRQKQRSNNTFAPQRRGRTPHRRPLVSRVAHPLSRTACMYTRTRTIHRDSNIIINTQRAQTRGYVLFRNMCDRGGPRRSYRDDFQTRAEHVAYAPGVFRKFEDLRCHLVSAHVLRKCTRQRTCGVDIDDFLFLKKTHYTTEHSQNNSTAESTTRTHENIHFFIGVFRKPSIRLTCERYEYSKRTFAARPKSKVSRFLKVRLNYR